MKSSFQCRLTDYAQIRLTSMRMDGPAYSMDGAGGMPSVDSPDHKWRVT